MCDRRHPLRRETEELKQIIRSIIVSNGNKITLRTLLREYKDVNGSELQSARFGYESPLELIKDMDDAFAIEIRDDHRYQLDYCVRCLSNENTDHIMDMVENQRHAEQRNRDVLHPFLIMDPKNRYTNSGRQKIIKPFKLIPKLDSEDNEQQLNGTDNGFPNRWNQKPIRRAVCPLPDSRVITNDEKIRIYELMTKFSSINLLNFESIYRVTHNKTIDYKKFGFDTLHQFLTQIPDLVQLCPSNDGLRVVSTKAHTVKPEPNGIQNGLSNGSSNGFKTNRLIQPKYMKTFLNILRKNPNGIPVYQFLDDYYKTVGQPFISDLCGYGSPMEMFANLKDVFYLQKPSNSTQNMSEWILLESTPQLRAQTKRITVPKKKIFDQQIKDNVNKLMLKIHETNGHYRELSVEEFADAYDICFNKSIDPKTYGYNDFKSFLLNLSKDCDFEVKEKVKFRPFVVYRKKFID